MCSALSQCTLRHNARRTQTVKSDCQTKLRIAMICQRRLTVGGKCSQPQLLSSNSGSRTTGRGLSCRREQPVLLRVSRGKPFPLIQEPKRGTEIASRNQLRRIKPASQTRKSTRSSYKAPRASSGVLIMGSSCALKLVFTRHGILVMALKALRIS